MKQTVKPLLVPGFKEVSFLDWIIDESCFNTDKETLTKKLGDSMENIFKVIDEYDLLELVCYYNITDEIISAITDDEDEQISKYPVEILQIYADFYDTIRLYTLDLLNKCIKERAELEWDEQDFQKRQAKAADKLVDEHFEKESKPVYKELDSLDKEFERWYEIYQTNFLKHLECKKSKRKPTKRHRSITLRSDVTE